MQAFKHLLLKHDSSLQSGSSPFIAKNSLISPQILSMRFSQNITHCANETTQIKPNKQQRLENFMALLQIKTDRSIRLQLNAHSYCNCQCEVKLIFLKIHVMTRDSLLNVNSNTTFDKLYTKNTTNVTDNLLYSH